MLKTTLKNTSGFIGILKFDSCRGPVEVHREGPNNARVYVMANDCFYERYILYEGSFSCANINKTLLEDDDDRYG